MRQTVRGLSLSLLGWMDGWAACMATSPACTAGTASMGFGPAVSGPRDAFDVVLARNILGTVSTVQCVAAVQQGA